MSDESWKSGVIIIWLMRILKRLFFMSLVCFLSRILDEIDWSVFSALSIQQFRHISLSSCLTIIIVICTKVV
jgi:hypothetical protein